MKRKNMYFFLVLATFLSLIIFVQYSSAKYKDVSELDISINSAKMYFEDNASDIFLPYSNNTAHFSFDVHNYINQEYTIQNINYKVSISNSNYTFRINNVSSNNNELSLIILGGARNSDSLNMEFIRQDTSNVPGVEDIEVTISTSYPYTYTKTFTVKILAGRIEVQGNPTQWTNNDVILTVVATTQGTTLTEYSFDGGTTWISSNSKLYTVNTNNIQVLAKDQFGQILGPINLDISKIDKTSPEFSITKSTEYNSDGTTKQVETLIVYLNEATSVLTGISATDLQSGLASSGIKCYRNGNEITTTDYFTSVGRYAVTYEVEDEVGNQASVNREILVRWPLAGKYVVARQTIVGTGQSSQAQGAGLYRDDNSTGLDTSLPFSSKYYYSGATVNNYLNFAGKQFRIMNVPVNDDLKIIGNLSSQSVRWGLDSLFNVGTNRKIYDSELYGVWQNTWWQNMQLYNSNDSQFIQFTNTEWNHIDNATFYAGRFKSGDITTFSDIVDLERTSAIDLGGNNSPSFQGYSAFPNVSDYIRACNMFNTISTIDDTQNNPRDFKNNSWLSSDADQWTMNSESNTAQDDDFWVLETDILLGIVNTQNKIEGRTFNIQQQYRPVFYLKNDTILSGTGTSSDAFTVEENWAWFDSLQILQ